jgi:hypothetical protein
VSIGILGPSLNLCLRVKVSLKITFNPHFLKFASPGEDLCSSINQYIYTYSYKVGKYCIDSSSSERVGIYFSGLRSPPWVDLLPQEKYPTAGLELTTFRSIRHMQICDSFCIAAAYISPALPKREFDITYMYMCYRYM